MICIPVIKSLPSDDRISRILLTRIDLTIFFKITKKTLIFLGNRITGILIYLNNSFEDLFST